MRRMQNVWDGNRLFERLHALDKAVAAVNELQTVAPFETIVRVSADVGMSVEAFLTPRLEHVPEKLIDFSGTCSSSLILSVFFSPG